MKGDPELGDGREKEDVWTLQQFGSFTTPSSTVWGPEAANNAGPREWN